MSETVLHCLAAALDAAANSDGNVFDPPLAVLWPDQARQWTGCIQQLRQQRRVLTLGAHDPGQGSGPAYWLRCIIASTIEDDVPDGLPIVYLPGVSRDDLRSVAPSDMGLAPLAALQHRSQWFAQASGKDWTVRALLTNKDRGLDLSVAGDDATAQALVAGLEHLLREPLARLEDRHIDAAFVNGLMNPDLVRLLLRWIDSPKRVEHELGSSAWDAFVSQCKSEYAFNPDAAGVFEAARRLGIGDGAWHQVWQRFREAPTDYPGIPDKLRDARPQELFTAASLAWPQDNEAEEDQLRARLRDLVALTETGARDEIFRLEDAHRARRGSVWAQLGESPLALALEHLSELAGRSPQAPAAGDVQELCRAYKTDGWKTDLAALRALAEVAKDSDLLAVSAALEVIYQPWLHRGATALQEAVGPAANSGTYLASGSESLSNGEVLMFVDGLRLDVAHLLGERLRGAGASVTTTWGLAALPTVTQTAKPVLVPIEQSQLGPGKAIDACRVPSGVTAGVQVLRSLLAEAGVQVLGAQDTGNPLGRAWTETGEIDHKGHDMGARLAHEIGDEVSRIARRTWDLLGAGWSTVTVVTDHGWLLLPSGLPKNESLPIAATVAKKGRCARIKDGASVDVPTVSWHWDTDVRIALAPGISCFEANQAYEHGGVSPQECVVPRLIVTATPIASATRAEITSMRWRGLTFVVEFADLPDGAKVDLRREAGNPRTSVAELARITGGTGKVILLVENEDFEGRPAQLVVVSADGTVLLQRETRVGQNR